MQKHNFHTHTRYSDGLDTPRQMIEAARELGFTALGFSDHSYNALQTDYCMSQEGEQRYYREINSLKAEYRNEISIYAGIELDAESELPAADWDFIIASVHEAVRHGEHYPIDSSADEQRKLVETLYGGSFTDFAKDYYNRVTEHVIRNKTDIVGHLDLPTKYGLCPEDDPRYRDAATEAVREIVKTCKVFELNTGAMARGLRKEPYPAGFLLDEIKSSGGSVLINSDCHDRNKLTCWFDGAEELLTAHGFQKYENQRLNKRIDGITLWK